MGQILLYWIISVFSLVVSAWAAGALGFDVRVSLDHPLQVFMGVAILGLINATIGTVAKFVTAPLNCLTFGLVWTAVNALLFWWVGQWNIGFHVGDFWSALVGSIAMGLVLVILRRITMSNGSKVT
jgi:putative membrane protein